MDQTQRRGGGMSGKIQKGEYCRAGKTLDVPPFFARVVGLSLSCSSLSAQENTSTSPAQTQTQALALHTCSTKINILLVGTCPCLSFTFLLLRGTIFGNVWVSVDIPHPEFKSFSDHFWRQSIKSCGGFGRVSCVHCVSSVHNTHIFSPQLWSCSAWEVQWWVVGSPQVSIVGPENPQRGKGESVWLPQGWIIQSTLPDKIQREPQLKEMARTRGKPLSLFLHHWIIERGGTFTFAKRKIYKSKYFAR